MDIFEKAKSQFLNNLPFVLFARPNENLLNAYFQGLTKIVLPKENSAYFEEEIDFNLSFKSESIQIPTLNEDKIHFENLVNNSVEAIKSGNFEKLVVSRKIDFSAGIDVFHQNS